MNVIRSVFASNWLYLIGAVIGGVLGYIYYVQVGCLDGSCAIKSDPTRMTIWGAIMGALVLSLFKRSKEIE